MIWTSNRARDRNSLLVGTEVKSADDVPLEPHVYCRGGCANRLRPWMGPRPRYGENSPRTGDGCRCDHLDRGGRKGTGAIRWDIGSFGRNR